MITKLLLLLLLLLCMQTFVIKSMLYVDMTTAISFSLSRISVPLHTSSY
jgi:hypothetical protein